MLSILKRIAYFFVLYAMPKGNCTGKSLKHINFVDEMYSSGSLFKDILNSISKLCTKNIEEFFVSVKK